MSFAPGRPREGADGRVWGMDTPHVPVDAPSGPRHPQPGDGWVECPCGRRHWGLVGAAGLLVVRYADSGAPDSVVLQHRAPWSDQGDTWAVPGGALMPGESAVQGALREAAEEAGIVADAVRVLAEEVLDHRAWRYTTVIARAVGALDPRPTDAESLAVRWVPVAEVPTLPLLPAFARAWPRLVARAHDESDTVAG